MKYSIVFDTPLGTMALAGEEHCITNLYLPNQLPDTVGEATPLLTEGRRQLLEYLSGTRTTFDLPLCAAGTPFRQRVWGALGEIPYGETISYKTLALRVDCPKGVRAVGQANHHNPISIFIPCHRVVGADGSLVGYGGGLALKRALLSLEGIAVID